MLPAVVAVPTIARDASPAPYVVAAGVEADAV